VHAGEIVGIAGLVGAGRSEVLETIYGARHRSAGTVVVQGRPIGPRAGTAAAVRAGLALAPEERKAQALLLDQSVTRNVSLATLPSFARAGWLDRRREAADASAITRELDVRPADTSRAVRTLSGGNQQKVVLGRWLLGSTKVLMLDEPTRGVDVGAKVTIYQLISDLAARGTALLLISSEHEEVLALSHRVHLVRNGTLLGEVDPRATSVDDLLYRLFEVGGAAAPGGPADQDEELA
jgi:ribose transport system ATP-binding protein